MPIAPVPSGQNEPGNFDRFTEFARRLMAVPHSQIKAQLEAEREAKRTSKASASHVSGVRPKRANQNPSVSSTLPVSSASVNLLPGICDTASARRSASLSGLSLVARSFYLKTCSVT